MGQGVPWENIQADIYTYILCIYCTYIHTQCVCVCIYVQYICDNWLNEIENGRKAGTVRSYLHLLRVFNIHKKTYVYSNTAIETME